MDRQKLRALLDDVSAGRISAADAFQRLRVLPYEDIGFARVDLHRAIRSGAAEAVFCQGKTPEQVVGVVTRLATHHANVLATRASADVVAAIAAAGLPHRYDADARRIGVAASN